MAETLCGLEIKQGLGLIQKREEVTYYTKKKNWKQHLEKM
jgi:hypothetical protein